MSSTKDSNYKMNIMFSSFLRKLVTATILLVIFIQTHFAFSYEMDLDILRLYLSESPEKLAMGGFDLSTEREYNDLYHPAKLLLSERSYISFILANENVFNDENGKWKSIRIKSKESKLTGIINQAHDGILKKTTIGFQYSYDTAKGYADYTRDNFHLDYCETAKNRTLTFAIQTGELFAFGGGLEDTREDMNFFWEAELRTYKVFSLGLRNFRREFNLDLAIEKDNIYGHIPVNYSEDVLEMTMKIGLHKRLNTCFIIDAKHLDRKTYQLSLDITKRFCLEYLRQYGNFDYYQDIFVNGSDSGHNNGRAEYSQWIAGLRFRRNERTTYHFNVRKFDFKSDSAGLVESHAVLSFWENLLAGKRYFNYNVEIDSMQYHFGIESRWTKRLTMRTGFQYIDMKPTGILDHWTPFPFIGIGRMDEQIREFSYSKMTLGILAVGFGYYIKNLELRYGLGQYILLSLKKREDIGDGDKGVEEEKWYKISWDDIKEAWEKIKDNPGGTLHVLEVRWYF